MLRLATPLALGEASFLLITFTDFIMLGWLGEQDLAAAALGLNWVWMVQFLGFGILASVGPIAAQALGARSLRLVRRTVRQGFWVALTVTPFLVAAAFHTEPILVLLGQDAALAARAGPYIQLLALGIPATMGSVVLWELFVAHQRPRAPMVVANLAIVLNAGLDYLLIFGVGNWPGLGMIGAGIASALVSWFIFAILLGLTLRDRRFRRYALFGRFWRPDWPRYREIFRVGLPLGLSMVIEMGFFAAATFLIGHYDTAALAAHAVALEVVGLVYMLAYGLGHAASVRIGHAAGAGDGAAIRLSGWAAVQLAIASTALICLGLVLFGAQIMTLFSERDGPAGSAFVATGVELLLIGAVFLVFDAARCVLHGNLTGLKDTRWPMVLQALAYWVIGLGTALLIAEAWQGGAQGVWWGITCGTATGALLLTWRWRRVLGAVEAG